MKLVEIEDITRLYLTQHFPDYHIERTRESDAAEDICFKVYSSLGQYFLRIQKEVVEEQNSKEDYEILLENYQVASTMKNLGDFPVVVTTYGCMFGSP